MKKLLTIGLLLFIGTAQAGQDGHRDAFGTDSLTSTQRLCYSLGTIGHDTVVNADSGVSPYDALMSAEIDGGMSVMLTNVILNAYKWQASPHEYAIKVYTDCTQALPDKEERM